MARTATAKRSTTTKKATGTKSKKAQKTTTKAKPRLKIVKSNARKVKKSAAKKAKSKVSAKKAAAKKPTTKKVASKKPTARKAVAKKTSAKKTAVKATKKPALKSAKIVKSTAGSKKTKKKMVARPIAVSSGFNRAARVNSIVKKRAAANAKNKNTEFKVGCYVVYPTHGVGKIIAEEAQEIGGVKLKMFVIEFVKDKMTLRVPTHRAQASGLRHVSGGIDIKKMYETLKSKAKTSRGMWSRRAQEYEAKINSGDVIMIAEVVRDLHQNVDQAERSYSERMIYESAFNRLAGELSASERMEYDDAGDKLLKLLRAKKAA